MIHQVRPSSHHLLQIDTAIHTAVIHHVAVDILEDVAAVEVAVLVEELDLLAASDQRH